MNPVVIVHLVAAGAVVVAAAPLARRRVQMNHWYGVRIPAAFESEEAWFDINQYGGRLFIAWGLLIATIACVGAVLHRHAWVTYDWTALVIIIASLIAVVAMIYRYARRRRNR